MDELQSDILSISRAKTADECRDRQGYRPSPRPALLRALLERFVAIYRSARRGAELFVEVAVLFGDLVDGLFKALTAGSVLHLHYAGDLAEAQVGP